MNDVSPRPSVVGVAVSYATDPDRAVAEAVTQIDLAATCFLLVLVPEGLALGPLSAALSSRAQGVPAFGCTTAGQITPSGYDSGALLILAFPRRHFRCASLPFESLSGMSIKAVADEARRHEARFPHTAGWNRLALVFVDGLSKREDVLVSTLQTALDSVPVFGGSAGNGLSFRETHVLSDGVFRSDAALMLLIETDLDVAGIGFDHFLPTDTQMVVTAAIPEDRLVLELNGAPAAQEYARLVGCPVDRLSPRVFAENPMLVRQNHAYHVRAVHGAPGGAALSFLSAIDDGLILTLGRGRDIVETLDAGLDVRGAQGRAPDVVLGFDCVLRRLEIEHKHLSDPVSDVFRRRRVIGFNTYGEQHRGVHVNQTFVGVAFFEAEGRGRELQ
ncbi:FIST N-terminal domain-containing protein [Roseivivax marinus]|uniref:FIST N-terminal domain-containing protein n=1 Tax=Roseivivax marinus TaxID=1379903 RepID=UPI0004B33D1F|nr:FIST N-terminal domain-containing protein [Roseivivax marinus]